MHRKRQEVGAVPGRATRPTAAATFSTALLSPATRAHQTAGFSLGTTGKGHHRVPCGPL